jgi:hypothetical protein
MIAKYFGGVDAFFKWFWSRWGHVSIQFIKMSYLRPVCPDVDSMCWMCIYSNIFIIGR